MTTRCVVTGVAGFIGSQLAERLLADGWRVTGVDCFTDYYDPQLKRTNLAALEGRPGFELLTADLSRDPLGPVLTGAEVVFHQAAQPGVRASWGAGFGDYVTHNVTATQRLLEACRHVPTLRRLVYASSSSVYGDAETLPTREDALPLPVSPYGVTKLAAEHLCRLYATGLGVPAVSLRYFTVFGPRQRPDMAFTRFCRALVAGQAITVNGDGTQTRDFTYVDDIVEANLAAATAPAETVVGRAYNLGGGTRISVNEVLEHLFKLAGRRVPVHHVERAPGDARHTAADTSLAARDLAFAPRIALADGLERQLAWAAAVRA